VGGPPRLVQPPFLNVDNRCSTSTIVAFLTALPIAYFGGRALAVAEPRYTPISAGQSTSQRRFRNHPSSLVRGADPVCAGCAIPLRPQPHDGVVKFAFICPGTNRGPHDEDRTGAWSSSWGGKPLSAQQSWTGSWSAGPGTCPALPQGPIAGTRLTSYYTCSNCATKGKTVCKGRSLPMEKLDRLVTENLMERLFKPERMSALLASLAARRAEKAESLSGRLIALQRQITEAEDKLARLYRLVEDGLTDLDEVLSDRLAALKAERDRAKAALERAKESSSSQIRIDPALIERFGRVMRENFSTGSVPFRKAYLQALIDSIEVDDDVVRIRGSKEVLEKAILASQNRESCSQMSTNWRARRDSNS
jgi:hypothetical protein